MHQLLHDILDLVRKHYIFPAVAAEVATAIERRTAAGEFDDLGNPDDARTPDGFGGFGTPDGLGNPGNASNADDPGNADSPDRPDNLDRFYNTGNPGGFYNASNADSPDGPGNAGNADSPGNTDGIGDLGGFDVEGFAARVTAVFHEVSGDRHLRLLVRSPDHRTATTPEEAEAAWLEAQRLGNHHIAAVRRLDGNVGYIDLRGVASPGTGGPAVTAAMLLVAHTGALIFDLRRNKGGDPDGVQLWHSYLFPDSDTHLNDIYDGRTGTTRQFWTLAYVPGPRYLDRPVYVLTSDFTFSAGEEFAYNLQALRRATLVGEVTRGGAHPTDRFPVSPALEVAVPIARSINPVTGTNWEGTGVTPDVTVPAGDALRVAHRSALEHVLTTPTSHAVLAEAREALADFSSNS
ncbi:S41 family peptidase [Dactylosporangium sp. NPDC005555]|uniref:S41 family peptidase n=1 Tax=Dactylosporangium sp. NPDC005555 TaxID=3154889 RepID=UPI0033B42E36